jgi:hypothetical protein
MPDDSPKLRPVFSLRWLQGMVLVAALLYLALVGLRGLRDTARASQHLNDMWMLSMGLSNYHGALRDFPTSTYFDPQGNPVCGWRPMVVPHCESTELEFDRTQPWNSPTNLRFGGIFQHRFVWEFNPRPGDEFNTNVLGIAGPGAMLDNARVVPIKIAKETEDMFLLIEVRDTGIHWMEPGDLDYRDIIERERNGSLTLGVFDDSFCVALADGSAWRLRSDTPRDLLLKFMTLEGARAHDAEKLLRPYRLDNSRERVTSYD